jgi:protein-S-isoprenylcysteine O-methyltransferase Ste14
MIKPMSDEEGKCSIEEETLVHGFGRRYLDYSASTKRFIPGVF